MARKFEGPFVPDMRDCKMVVETDGATCYILDTFCRNFTKADKERADREFLRIYQNEMIRKKEKEMA